MSQASELSGLELAVAVAVRVMGWLNLNGHEEDKIYPCFVVYKHQSRDMVYVWRGKSASGVMWKPWHDMRAVWEIVERMGEDKWELSMSRYDNMWVAGFTRGDVESEVTAATPGEAVMRAALAAKEEENKNGDETK